MWGAEGLVERTVSKSDRPYEPEMDTSMKSDVRSVLLMLFKI
jgi:hypothetical protein